MGDLSLGLLPVLFALALLPTRRLWVAGARLKWRVGYVATLIVLGLAVIEFEDARPLPPADPATALPGAVQRSGDLVGNAGTDGPARGTIIEGHAVRLDPDDPVRH